MHALNHGVRHEDGPVGQYGAVVTRSDHAGGQRLASREVMYGPFFGVGVVRHR